MAAMLGRHKFNCPVCLELLTDPVSTPCGHNFCKICIETYWDSTELCQCPLCKETFYKRPELRINTAFQEVVDHFKNARAGKVTTSEAKPNEVACDVCTGMKLKALKSCLVCLASFCETHLEPHMTAGALSRHKLIKPTKNLEERKCKKHDRIMELFCKKEEIYVCDLCAETDHSRHQVVTLEEESQQKIIQTKRREREVDLMIQDRQKRLEEIKLTMEQTRENAQKEMTESVQVFTALMKSMEETHTGLMEEIEARQESEQMRFEGLIEELTQEIAELEKKSIELEEFSHTEDHLAILDEYRTTCAFPSTQNWASIPVYKVDFLGYIRDSLIKAKEIINLEIKNQSAVDLKKIQHFAEDVTIDPNTAGSWLVVSEDGKEVSQSPRNWKQKVQRNSARFAESLYVVATQGLHKGRHYWEVKVGEKANWMLGVASDTIKRGEHLTPSPEKGFWTLSHRDGKQYVVSAQKSFPFGLSPHPHRVGVFVDYEESQVSFFNVEAKTHIFTYTKCKFAGKVYPIFEPCLTTDKKETSPLKIMTVEMSK